MTVVILLLIQFKGFMQGSYSEFHVFIINY